MSASDITNTIVNLVYGGAGALGVSGFYQSLIIWGKLHTTGEIESVKEDRDRIVLDRDKLMTAWQTEVDAHNETRKALNAANDRADQASDILVKALAQAPGRRTH